MLEYLFTCCNILKMRITSYTIAYLNLNIWLRSTKEKIECWVRRLIIWKGNVNLIEAWKVKKKLCLKVKNVCLMQAYLCIPHWRYLIHACGILTATVLVIWQEINHCLRHSKRRLVTMWLLVVEVMLKFSAKGLLRYLDYLYWKMSYTSKGWRRIFWASLIYVMRIFLSNSQRRDA